MGGAARTWMTAVPLFPVVLGAGLVLSAVFARSLATRLRMPDWVVLGILASLSLIAAATLSPGADGVWGSCLRDVAHPLGRGLLAGGDRSLNTWLFVPLGFFSALGARARPWVLPAAFAVPFVVEGTQRVLPWLGRRCQFQDLVDNTWGVVLGAAAGLLIGFLTTPTERR
ncbi:MAG: VanZ family protein [Actinobacteria bacterium]|nr:VanZ family protein [Actinomycetota bacterium]MCB8996534.1 VanZ family protein [Actinomycetota bacterium]